METVYDRALSEVGSNGIFQKKFDILYNVVLVTLWVMVYMNTYLALVIIPHTCAVPEKTENISDHLWKIKYIPIIENATGQLKFNSCFIYTNPNENNNTRECDKYNYDKTWYESTVASDYNWVCGKELYVANIFAYSRIGEIIGSISFGWFGDIKGRRLTYIMSLVLIFAGRTISIFAGQSYVLFVTGCIIASFPSWSVVQSVTIISLEISSPERRTSTATLRLAACSLGVCLMPLFYWWLREWKLFIIVTTVTQLPFLIFSWKIIESPRWLWVEGKTKSCIKQLKTIAKSNKTKLNPETEQELLLTLPGKNIQTFGPLALFSGWTLAINTLLQLYMWVSVTLSYTIMLMSSGEKSDGNPFIEFALQSAAEIPGNIVAAWLADHIGRRYTGVAAFGVTSVMWTLIAFRENSGSVWYRQWWLGTVFVITNRISSTICYYLISLFNMELYPTCIRQSGMSLGNVVSSGASAVAPYILYLGRRINLRLPGLLLSGISMLGIISSLLLPETLNAKLPETIEDAQTFGKGDKRYFSLHWKQSSKLRSTDTELPPESDLTKNNQ